MVAADGLWLHCMVALYGCSRRDMVALYGRSRGCRRGAVLAARGRYVRARLAKLAYCQVLHDVVGTQHASKQEERVDQRRLVQYVIVEHVLRLRLVKVHHLQACTRLNFGRGRSKRGFLGCQKSRVLVRRVDMLRF